MPDVVVFFHGGRGVCHDTFWTGGPDFAVEITSEGEVPADKFEFYGGLGTRELLVIERDPWRLELYGPQSRGMQLLQAANLNDPAIISNSVELSFSLHDDQDEVEFVVEHRDGRRWAL